MSVPSLVERWQAAAGGHASSFISYATKGSALAAGFEPAAFDGPPGSDYYRWGPTNFVVRRSPIGGDLAPIGIEHAGKMGLPAMRGTAGVIAGAGALAGTGFMLYDMYQGYQKDGMKGVFDAAVWNIAQNAAVARFAYTGMGTATVAPKGFLEWGARTVGAGIGASIGQSMLGTPGAFIGAYAGAAPARMIGKGIGAVAKLSPLAMGIGVGFAAPVAIGALGTAAVVGATFYGAKQLANIGANRTAMQRRIDTSGSMAAFMTSNSSTMRARAVQAMNRSHMNARSALGQEANLFSSNKNYFSVYR